MQQITNPYLDFGKELIAKHSGLGYYYDSISLIHPEYEEESEKQPENHNYITNITKLQILKEYNELFQNNLTFLTRVMSKKVVEKIYPSFEVRVEKKISELLPQAEKEITDSITEKYLSLKTKEETQNLTVFKQILQEKQITSQLSEKQVLQTIRNIENYENSLSHYEDVYTRQIRQTVERYAGIAVQPTALAEAKTEAADAKANRQNSQKRLTDNRMLTTGQKIDAQIIPDHKLTRNQTATMGQGPAKAVAGDLIYHDDFSKDDPAVTQYTNPSGREKEFIRQEISRMVDRMNQPENQSVNRMISHIVEKREKLQNRQEDNTTVSTRIAQIIHQKIQEKQYQEERQQARQQQEKQQQERQQQERQQQEKRQQERKKQERQQEKQQQEKQQQEKQQQEKQQQERQEQERQQQEKQQQERQQQEKQHREKPAETYNINNVNNRLINTANRLNRLENIAVSNPAKEPVNRSDYENSDLVYHEDSGDNSESMPSTKELIRQEVSQVADRLLQQENRSVLPVINNHLTYEKNNPVYNASRISESRTVQNSDQGKGQVKESENSQNDQNQHIQNNNRFTDSRIRKIAQTVNRLKQLENRMVHDHTVMIINRINDGDRKLVYNSFLQTENPISGQIIGQAGHQMIHPSGNEVYQTVDNRIYPVISQISHKAGDLIHNQTIQETSCDSLQKNNNVNHIIHRKLTKMVNQMMYSQNDRNGADSYRYMEMPVELVYGAGPDNRKGDALNITAGEQNHIQEKTIQNVVKDIEFVKETKKIVKNQVHETILQKEPEKETEVVWEGTGRNSKQIMEQLLKTIDRKVDESVGQIADRVYRNLEDRLRNERNRRGY